MKTTSARSRRGGHTRRAAAALLLALAAIPGACRRSDDGLRGQSGSEAPADNGGNGGGGPAQDQNPPCPCGTDAIFLRVTVLESQGPRRRVRVDEVIHGETDRAAGDELDVDDSGRLPCFVGSAPVADGEPALAAFTPADEASCDASDCGTDGSVRLTPWTDPLLFAQTPAGAVSVPASELGSLWSDDVDRCIERHGDAWLLDTAAPAADEP